MTILKEKIILPPKYQLGESGWDDQHATIISLLKYLLESSKMNPKRRPQYVDEVLIELKQYASSHFSYERRKMSDEHTEDEKAHIKEHDFFLKEIVEMERISSNGLDIVSETAGFLSEWFQNHILKRDHELYANSELSKASPKRD